MAGSHVFSKRGQNPGMPKLVDALGLAQFVAATAGRNMPKAAYVGVLIGIVMVVLITVDPAYEAAHHWIRAVLWACLAFFAFEWAVRIRYTVAAGRGLGYLFSLHGLVDAASVIAVPLARLLGADPRTAWLVAVVWVLEGFSG